MNSRACMYQKPQMDVVSRGGVCSLPRKLEGGEQHQPMKRHLSAMTPNTDDLVSYLRVQKSFVLGVHVEAKHHLPPCRFTHSLFERAALLESHVID